MKSRQLSLVLVLVFVLAACTKTEDTSPPVFIPDAGPDVEEDIVEDVAPDVEPEPDVPLGPGNIVVSPESFTFRDVRLGSVAEQTIAIRNVGTGPLRIADLSLAQSTVRTQVEFKKGAWLDLPAVLEPNTFREVVVLYEPLDYVTDRGSLTIYSDDPETPEVELRIETINAYPDMRAPHALRFGTVAPGEVVTERVVIYNRGGDPLNISAVTYENEGEGPSRFSLAFPGTQSPPALIQRTEFLLVDVTYSPQNTDTDRGRIYIDSNDPDQERFEILVVGNGPTPCISVSGDVDFGEATIGERVTQQVTLLNCSGSQPLSVTDVELVDDGAGTFEIVGNVDLPISLGVRQTANFTVAATVSTEQDVVGLLKITSTDPEQDEIELSIRIKGAVGN